MHRLILERAFIHDVVPRSLANLKSQHSNCSSSAWNTVFQYTPVASIPTSVTPASASHPANSASPARVDLKVRVC